MTTSDTHLKSLEMDKFSKNYAVASLDVMWVGQNRHNYKRGRVIKKKNNHMQFIHKMISDAKIKVCINSSE